MWINVFLTKKPSSGFSPYIIPSIFFRKTSLPVIGLNTAVLSMGWQNCGAKAYNRIRELYTKALLFGSSFMAIAGIIIFFGAEFFVSLFTDNQEAVGSGAIYLKVAALIGPIYPVFFITTAVFQAVKKPLYSLYLSILRLTAFPFLSLWYVINIRQILITKKRFVLFKYII